MSTPPQSRAIFPSSFREYFAYQRHIAGWLGVSFERARGIVDFLILCVAIVDLELNVNLTSGIGLAAMSARLVVLGLIPFRILEG